jgi:hypothetical protein
MQILSPLQAVMSKRVDQTGKSILVRNHNSRRRDQISGSKRIDREKMSASRIGKHLRATVDSVQEYWQRHRIYSQCTTLHSCVME